ncbi:beta-galactosidase [uncultured Thiohalocapsa sp.]|uniref:beta-galactosidase n=1 Tax=uncultured Thiohalocapsa sp. TaxID=768990 RepID=UPI0025EC0370|nr:beta-galactosidase [uncultured Thiohalocapsa sp.]
MSRRGGVKGRRSRLRVPVPALGLALLAALVWLPWRPSAGVADAPEVRRSIVFSEFLGVNTPFLFFDAAAQRRQVERLKALGLKWVRLDLHWYHLEPREGQFDLAALDRLMALLRAADIEPVVYLVGSARFASTAPPGAAFIDPYPPRSNSEFAARMVALAERYPWVCCWQIWNEPNIHTFWQPQEDPAAYGELVAASVAALRHAAPTRRLVLGGMAYFSQMPKRGGLMLEALQREGILDLVDVVAYHPYTDKPEGDTAMGGSDGFLARSHRVNSWLRRAGVEAIWATELGWSTYTGPKVWQSLIDETDQADYLLRRLALMMRADFDRVFWFALTDLDERVPPRDRFYGLLRRDGSPKPSYDALKRLLALTGDRLAPVSSPLTVAAANYAYAWRKPDGKRLVFFWGPQPQTLTLAGSGAAVLHDPVQGTRETLPPEDREVRLTQRFQVLELPASAPAPAPELERAPAPAPGPREARP